MPCGGVRSAVRGPDEARVGHRVDGHRLLSEAKEQQAAMARASTIESEGEFIEGVVQVPPTDGPLMGAEATSRWAVLRLWSRTRQSKPQTRTRRT